VSGDILPLMERILVLGGDGFCGWPTALHLSAVGHDVTIIDNLSRRKIDDYLGVKSLTPIAPITERLETWGACSGRAIEFFDIDIATDYEGLHAILQESRPTAIVHFAEQRAAPFSMRSPTDKRYTIDNNVRATHNVLTALADLDSEAHLVHLGTMGVYGYGTVRAPIPEGYLMAEFSTPTGERLPVEILYPTNPGSVYHLTKSLDQLMFAFYAKNDGLRITDLHQGIVWGTSTDQTSLDKGLINRFDYDGDYGTVLNRFLVQAAIGYPLTVHGSGGQTRAFIHLRDSVKCIELAISSPPSRGDRVRVMNQVTETHRVSDLADLVAELTGAEIAFCDNPRKEDDRNDLEVVNQNLLSLGLRPTLLANELLEEISSSVSPFAGRIDRSKIPCTSTWTRSHQPGVPK